MPLVRRSRRCVSAHPILIAAIATLSVGACTERDAYEQAVLEAGIVLKAPASTDSSNGTTDDAYSEVLNLLPSADGEDESTNRAAAVRRALAMIGLGTSKMADAARLERTLGYRADELRGLLSQWTILNSQADAAASFDPTPQISQLRENARARQNEREELLEDRQVLSDAIDALTSRIQRLFERASATRADAADLRLEAAQLSAREAAVRAVQIRELTRSADELEREALRLQAQAEVKQPELDEVDARLAQKAEEGRVIAEAIDDLTARSDTQRTRAVEYREKAAEIAVKIGEGVGSMQAFQSDDFGAAIDEAIELLGRASRETKAAGAASQTALLTQSVADQRLGEVQLLHSRGLTEVSNVLGALAAVRPALPGSNELQVASDEASSAALEAKRASSDAFGSASSAARRLRLTGEARQTAGDLADLLDAAAGGGAEDEEPLDVDAGVGSDVDASGEPSGSESGSDGP